MELAKTGDRVRVADRGRVIDGIVFDTPSRSKVVVAMAEPRRGPVFRTVHSNDCSARDVDGPDDPALLLLIRRTPPAPHSTQGGAAGPRGQRAAHTRGAMHRTTGR